MHKRGSGNAVCAEGKRREIFMKEKLDENKVLKFKKNCKKLKICCDDEKIGEDFVEIIIEIEDF